VGANVHVDTGPSAFAPATPGGSSAPVEDPDLREDGRLAAAKRSAGAADGLRRRAFLATSSSRNLR
jgi:hypothetical protein